MTDGQGSIGAPPGGAEEATFQRLGGVSALAAAVVAPVYAVAFVVLKNDLLSSLGLMVGGLLTAVALLAIYRQLRVVDPAFAQLGLLLGFLSAMGTAIHGAYNLANVVHVPSSAIGDLPAQIDPRGMLTFGVSALGLLALVRAAFRSDRFPRPLSYLGLVLALLLIIIYLGRLIVYDATSPLIVVPAAIAGLVVSPVWYAWVGYLLLRRPGLGAGPTGGAQAGGGARPN